jgi:hypothetical protein
MIGSPQRKFNLFEDKGTKKMLLLRSRVILGAYAHIPIAGQQDIKICQCFHAGHLAGCCAWY